MRLLYWTELFLPDIGGAEIRSLAFLNGLQRTGDECRVIACHGKTPLPDVSDVEGITVERFWFQRDLLRRNLAGIRETVERVNHVVETFRPDLIHLNTIQPSLFFYWRSATARQIPTLATLCEPPGRDLSSNSLEGKVLSHCRRVISVSHFTQRALLEKLPGLRSRSETIYNGLPLATAKPLSPSGEMADIFCAGRITREKGFDLAIEAFARLLVDRPGLTMTIAGDGPARQQLISQATQLGVIDQINFTGWIAPDSIAHWIGNHRLVVVPSRWDEPFGLIALEAAQMARPVIAAKVGGLQEVVEDGKTGILFQRDNAGDLADQMELLLAHPEMGEQMGRCGHEAAAEKFGFDRMLEQYRAAYQRVIREESLR